MLTAAHRKPRNECERDVGDGDGDGDGLSCNAMRCEPPGEFNATLSDRRCLMRWRDGHLTHHLHIVVLGGEPWHDRLAFRDAHRRDPALARRYAELKIGLAATHASDREAYTEAKAEFVRAVLAL